LWLGRGVLNTILCDKVCLWRTTDRWFSPGTPITFTNKTEYHDITEILLKVVLSTINHHILLLYIGMFCIVLCCLCQICFVCSTKVFFLSISAKKALCVYSLGHITIWIVILYGEIMEHAESKDCIVQRLLSYRCVVNFEWVVYVIEVGEIVDHHCLTLDIIFVVKRNIYQSFMKLWCHNTKL
jgi:hypothetical protein